MQNSLPITKILTNINKIKAEVAQGKEFIIFSRSTPVFKIVPLEIDQSDKNKAFWEEWDDTSPIGSIQDSSSQGEDEQNRRLDYLANKHVK